MRLPGYSLNYLLKMTTVDNVRIAVITNNTGVNLTYYYWVNPWIGDHYQISFKGIEPGQSVTHYIYLNGNKVSLVKDENGNNVLVNGSPITRLLIARSSDVGAFYDLNKNAPTFEADIRYNTVFTQIFITGVSSAGMTGIVKTSDILPDPSGPFDTAIGGNFDVPTTPEGSTADVAPDQGRPTQGNPTDDDSIGSFLEGLKKLALPFITGGALIALVVAVLLLRR